MIVIPIAYNPYVKKSELDAFIVKQRKELKWAYSFWVLISVATVVALYVSLSPRIGGLYANTGYQVPGYAQQVFLASLLLNFGMLIKIWKTNPIDDNAVEKLRSSTEDLVNTSSVRNKSLIWLTLGVTTVAILLGTSSVIFPVYQITESVK
ncbi:MAG: hypothetical protein A2802_02290 [Candidatus Woykebacteria bacterium RIFCSPHIGHO2_01_FULL_43_29]|nr:MAG: hypothetical protein A2802_02290 [Candidatus Woykebacteria bacterium RIFCSPHIGHO2_01_FULL_43_29]